ncbi:MAG: heavy metal translocating P-type ATPase metal-binding domain-containing protein [Pirellulaceae bacterium]|nr:heavy metal translocating P-type ATPase metal-binding domain-containing protein [Pirellulaceae bacterium]
MSPASVASMQRSVAVSDNRLDGNVEVFGASSAEASQQVTPTRPCAHCGLATSTSGPTSLAEPIFCCTGCRGAYQLIQGWGLSDFYALRDQMTTTGSARAAGGADNYQHFDTTEFLGQSAPVAGSDGKMTAELGVQGLHCAACSWLIERALMRQPGLCAVRVKLSDHTVQVIYDPEQAKLSGIARFLDRLGYPLQPLDHSRENHLRLENRQRLVQIAIAGFLAANAMWIAVALYAGQFSGVAAEHKYFFELWGMLLGAAAVLGPGRTFLTGAWSAIKARTPHMDLPIALALGVGTGVGLWNAVRGQGQVYFDGLSMLVFLLLIGRWLQFRQQHQAARAVELMMRITPRHATLLGDDGGSTMVLVDRLTGGDCIQVAAGESLPADGTLISGSSRLDRSLLTGESQPIAIHQGDQVEAGTINVGGPIVVRVSAVGKKSRIGRVMQAVESAAAQKTPLVQLADRIGGFFVMAVLVLAVATFLIWLPISFDKALNFGTAMLIVACPCALALATPAAIAVGIGRAARAGILIRDGTALQRLSQPGIIWFDKTGTLTEGRQHAQLTWGSPSAIQLAAAVEAHCHHPIAAAIVRLAENLCRADEGPTDSSHALVGVATRERVVSSVETFGGGIRGVVDQRIVVIGHRRAFELQGIPFPESVINKAEALLQQGHSPVFIAVDGHLAALVGLSDPVRRQASQAVADARYLGWSIGLLSGDHPDIARQVAQQVGIDPPRCLGGVSPEQKLAIIKQSRGDFATVVMIGDGANDAAALAAADVGIAVRGGAEVSLQAAPVYMAVDGWQNLAHLLRGSVATKRIIYFCFAVSLAYNLLAVGLTIAGQISPLIAAIVMPASSATVLGLTFAIPSFSVTAPKHSLDNWRGQ